MDFTIKQNLNNLYDEIKKHKNNFITINELSFEEFENLWNLEQIVIHRNLTEFNEWIEEFEIIDFDKKNIFTLSNNNVLYFL